MRVHLILLIEKAPCSIRDRSEVVADFVNDDGLEVDRYPLLRDAIDGQFRFVEIERKPAHGLDAGDDERAVTGDDLEAHALADGVGRAPRSEARDDERFVRFGDTPHRLEEGDANCEHDDSDDDIDAESRGYDHGCAPYA